MWNWIWEKARRFRTWLLNAGAVLLAFASSPELMQFVTGYTWEALIPQKYLPWFLFAVAFANVWMRWRPAVLPTDPEVTNKP